MNQRTELRQNEASRGGGTTPVPNVLLDDAMPRLRDTELRLLLVVVRQTLGWQEGPDPMHRKERDWLTQSQLMRRTGRASGAVSRAVDGLVRAGLIEVLDRAGSALGTPAERRRHLGRLYYRLPPGACEGQGMESSKSEYAKANTTKESRYKNIKGNIRRNGEIVDKSMNDPCLIRTKGWEHVTRR